MVNFIPFKRHLTFFAICHALALIANCRPIVDHDKFVVETISIDLDATKNALDSYIQRIVKKISFIDESDGDAHVVFGISSSFAYRFCFCCRSTCVPTRPTVF